MKKYFFIIAIFIFLSFKSLSGISGKYKVVLDYKFDPKQESNYTISIKEKNYIKKYPNGEKVEGGITIIKNRNEKNIYYLRDFLFVENKLTLDSLKLKPMGKVVMEVEESNEDTLTFRTTYSGQLQVTLNTGKLIRQE